MIHKTIRLLLIVFGACAIGAHAQTKTLSLEECRELALKQNTRMLNANSAITAANETSQEAFTNYFPNISATGFAYNANKGLIQMEMAPGQTMNLLKNGVLGGITVTQPIFAGGQIINGNRLAKVGVRVSELQREQTQNEVILTTEQYYWQIVTLMEKKRTLMSIQEMLDTLCHNVQAAVDAGLTTRNDLLQVQLKQNEISSAMLTLNNGLALSHRMLAQYIGINDYEIEILVPEAMDSVPVFPLNLYVDHTSALQGTPEYRLLQQNVEAANLKQKLAVGKNMPTVGIGAGYMYDNLTDKDHPFGVAFVSVSVPISGWWGGSHSIKKERANMTIANNTLQDGSEMLVINMQHLWDDVRDAHQNIVIAQKSVEQSSENLRLNQNYYNAGMTTMSDLLDAQSLYQQSRDKMVEAHAQFRIKTLQYRQATAQD